MRFDNRLSTDQELIGRFLTILGDGLGMLSNSKNAQPDFFIFANDFIRDYIEASFFKKEELFFNVLEDYGFPGDAGPIGSMRSEQKKSHTISETLLSAAKYWQESGEETRTEVVWAASEYKSILRQHLNQLNSLIFPLLEQNLSAEEERKIAEEIDRIICESDLKGDSDKYISLIEALESELRGWQ